MSHIQGTQDRQNPSSVYTDELSIRRTACDRCRAHKLRCNRTTDGDLDAACRRCLKIGASCVTSAAARIGRPPGTSLQQQHQSRLQRGQQQRSGEIGSVNADVGYVRVQMPTPPSNTPGDLSAECDLNVSEASEHHQSQPFPISQNDLGLLETAAEEEDFNLPFDFQHLISTALPSKDARLPSTTLDLPPALDKREECVRKLAELHTDLVLDLNIVRHVKTADKCTFLQDLPPEMLDTYNFPIGRMLSSSAKLLEVLQYFSTPLLSSADSDERSDHLRCDVPTMLSISTCYVYLIRVYRTLLTSIHDSLASPDSLPTSVPPIFPGLQLGGFSLDTNLSLQVQILVHVSENLLLKIDKAMGVVESYGAQASNSHSVLGRMSSSILNSMLEEEINEKHDSGVLVGNRTSLTAIMAKMKKL